MLSGWLKLLSFIPFLRRQTSVTTTTQISEVPEYVLRVGRRLERLGQLASANGEKAVVPRRTRFAVVAQGRRRLAHAPFERQRAHVIQ